MKNEKITLGLDNFNEPGGKQGVNTFFLGGGG